MKISFEVVALSVCAVIAMVAPAQVWDDEWRMKPSPEPGRVHFTVERTRPGNRSSYSTDVAVDRFRNLSLEALSKGGAASFEYVRDAGTLLCQGKFTSGRGIGTFKFVVNPKYAAELQRLDYDAPEENDLFSMLMADVSLDFARGVRDARVPSTTKQLLEMRIHGVTLDYIGRMRSSGYVSLTAGDYVQMKIHGVTPELVAELKKAGYDLPAKQIVEMKIHGVSPEFIRQLNMYGLRPDARGVVDFKIHGVKPEFLKTLKDAGYGALETRDILNLRIHSVSPEFIQEAKQLGYNFTPKELTELRIHGVDTAYLRKLQTSGFQGLSADKIVKLRIHGVD